MREISTKINYNYKWDSTGQNTLLNRSKSLCLGRLLEQEYGLRSHISARLTNGREIKLPTINLTLKKRKLRSTYKNKTESSRQRRKTFRI